MRPPPAAPRAVSINHVCMNMDSFKPDEILTTLESYGIKPRGTSPGPPGPMVSHVTMRMENRGGAKDGTPELYFTDPDGLLIQLQDVSACGGSGYLGDVCPRSRRSTQNPRNPQNMNFSTVGAGRRPA